ncbi:MAG: hypothetical protein RL169_1265 [Armatimonadota bacterium]
MSGQVDVFQRDSAMNTLAEPGIAVIVAWIRGSGW